MFIFHIFLPNCNKSWLIYLQWKAHSGDKYDDSAMIKKDMNIIRRSRAIQEGKRGRGPVIYWMERDFRLEDNWAMLYAQQEALIREKPIVVLIVIEPEQLHSKSIQNGFLFGGIAELFDKSSLLNITIITLLGSVRQSIPRIVHELECNHLVTDFSPLRQKKQNCNYIRQHIHCAFDEVDSHNIIPAWTASSKKEYGAYTIRPKIKRLLPDFLTPFPDLVKHPYSISPAEFLKIEKVPEEELRKHCIKPSSFTPGPTAATNMMCLFFDEKLKSYESLRNNPNIDGQSGLSPFLHFGHIAPQRLAYEAQLRETDDKSKASFLEELIVRRELADNFCLYEDNYDSFEGFHPWAQKTLTEHKGDKRQFCYTLEQLEDANTHEELWNSCQKDLVNNNKLHGFLRMYWAKKILEWTASPEEALYIANYLNDKYSIDGCDPNGYTGTAWSIGGIHDRAWTERPVFGKIRYMNENGCRRKFKVDEYIASQK